MIFSIVMFSIWILPQPVSSTLDWVLSTILGPIYPSGYHRVMFHCWNCSRPQTLQRSQMSVSLSDNLLTVLFYFSLICRAVLSRFCAQAISLLSAVWLMQAMCKSGRNVDLQRQIWSKLRQYLSKTSLIIISRDLNCIRRQFSLWKQTKITPLSPGTIVRWARVLCHCPKHHFTV